METQSPSSSPQKQQVDKPETKTEQVSRRRKMPLVIGGTLAVVAIGILLTMWILKKLDEPRRAAVQQALEQRDQARQDEAKAKKQLEQESTARQTASVQRNQALAAEKTAQRSQQIAKDVLNFLRKKLLLSGDPKGWNSVSPGKEVTLRQAVNRAEPKVAESFPDQPLREASIRQLLGTTYLDLGDAEKAVQQFERAMALWEALLGPEDPYTGDCRNRLAVAYRRAGRIDDAGRLFQRSPLSSTHAAALAIQGSALLTEKKPAAAELKLRESLSIRQKIQPDDWTTFDAQSMLGAALLDQKKYPLAEPMLVSGYEGMKQRQARIPAQDRSHLTRALDRLVHLYEVWGKPDKAAEWRKERENH